MKTRIIILLLLVASAVSGQDPHFSQLYAIPLYTAPSFAGTAGGTRVGLLVRDQWPVVDKEYVSYSASVDHYFAGTSSGAGLMMYRDKSGRGSLSTTSLTMQYSYSINLNRQLSLRPGLQGSLVDRRIDYSDIVFGDQLGYDGDKSQSVEPQLNENIFYVDFGASLLLFHSRFWVGTSVDHLARPNQSLIKKKSPVPMRFNAFGGVKFIIKNRGMSTFRRNMYLMYQYVAQEEFDQSYIGLYFENNNIITGLWYRGIPFQQTYQQYLNNDAVVFLFGYRWNSFLAAYSYDFTTSRFSANAGGSHELTITWTNPHKPKDKKRKMGVVPCPMH